MVLVLEILSGPLEGSAFPIVPGLRIGRTQGDIILDDSKVSSFHAQIEVMPDGTFFLVDQKSKNAISFDGKKVRKLKLALGVKFLIGRIELLVSEKTKAVENGPAVAEPAQPISWKRTLLREIPRLSLQKAFQPLEVSAFSPALTLDFVEGVQASSQIILGFGPRRFGSEVLDVDLLDPETPPLAFMLSPGPTGPQFVTDHPEAVLLNEKNVTSQTLANGDTIRVGKTLIKVSF